MALSQSNRDEIAKGLRQMCAMDLIVNDTRFDGNDVALGLELLALITKHREKLPAWEDFTSTEIDHWEEHLCTYIQKVSLATAEMLDELDELLALRIPRASEVQETCANSSPKKPRSNASTRKTKSTATPSTRVKR